MKTKPAHIVAYLKERAAAKRMRRGAKIGATAYAKKNAQRK